MLFSLPGSESLECPLLQNHMQALGPAWMLGEAQRSTLRQVFIPSRRLLLLAGHTTTELEPDLSVRGWEKQYWLMEHLVFRDKETCVWMRKGPLCMETGF